MAEGVRQVRAAPPPRKSSPALKPVGIALLVSGRVLLAVGIGLGVVATQSARDVATGSGEFSGRYASRGALGRDSMAAGIALDVIGGVAAAAGAGLLGWSLRGGERRVWLSPGVRTLWAGGTF